MKKPLPFGKYLLLDRINVGGMAEVFLAKSFGVEGFERILAIKKILPTMVEDEEFISMFIDEARIAVQLNHPNVVQIHELGKHEEHYFIAMEYLSGRDLRLVLDATKKRKQLLSIPQAVFLAQKICEGLDYAHRKKDPQGRELHIVHRDVSPQNVLISYDGEVKLIDFGIAKAQGRLQKTQAGILKGKFGYMSPEQVRGLPIDRRSDIFAVGVILYEMLTGERLFVGESDFSTLEKVRNAEVLPPRQFNEEIPEALEKVMLRSLAREPEERYQWASDMAEELTRFSVKGDVVYGTKQLSAFMHERFAPELERERGRLARFATVEKTEGSGTAPGPTGPQPVVAAAPPGAGIRASATVPFDALPSTPEADEPPPSEATQLFRPEFMAGADTGPMDPAPPEPAGNAVFARTVIRPDASGPRAAPTAPVSELAEADWPVPPPKTEGKTVIRAEPSNPNAGAPARPLPAPARPLPPATRSVPAAPAGRRGLPPPVLAGLGAAVVVFVALLFALLLRRPGPQPGTLVISPHPAEGVSLWVDGRPLSPAEHHTFVASNLAAGVHLVEAKNGTGRRALKVRVESGRIVPIAVELPAAPPPVVATTAAVPTPSAPPSRGPADGAAGPTGGPAPLAARPRPAKMGLDLSQTEAPPPPAPANVTIDVEPSEAQIFIDGAPVGSGSYVIPGADPAHRYRIEAAAPGRRRVERTLRFSHDQTVRLVLREEHAAAARERPPRKRSGHGPPGTLIISSRPVAKVFVDGRPTERYTPVPPSDPLQLPSGDHVIHLESDDGRKADRRITIEPNALNKLINVMLD